jgi:hypothetical protein
LLGISEESKCFTLRNYSSTLGNAHQLHLEDPYI